MAHRTHCFRHLLKQQCTHSGIKLQGQELSECGITVHAEVYIMYLLQVCDVSRSDGWVKVKEVDSSARLVACVEGLKEGKPYLFRVRAENQHGPGAATETPDAIVPRSQLGTL